MVVHERLELLGNLGVGDLGGRHVDLGRVIALELAVRAQGDLGGDLVVGTLGDEDGLVAVGGLANGHDVELVEHERRGLVQHVLGGLGEHVVLAHETVDDRARGLALAEALEAVLVGDVLVRLLDGGIDIGGGDGELGLERVVLGLGGGDGDLQRSS